MFKTTARWAWLGLMTPMGCAPEHADPLQAPGGGFDVGTGSAVWATVATPPAREGKRRDRVLVDPVDDDALREICAEHGVMTLQAPGRSGVAAIGVPASLSAAEFTALLSEDDRVDCVFEESWVSGATTGGALSWHLDAIGADGETPDGLDDVVVAVIDSGVAWSGEGSVGAVAAGSLSANPIASPWDFVEGDAHPQDEHQHGTHIASLIGSDGVVDGVAPGVGLMPLRVLDRNNQGTELDLVEAILWATDRGADVINLSVSFWPGYQPTLPLMMALDRAADAGVLVVAAAGNDGLDGVTWPAASPRVLAVGAVCSTADGRLERAPYSNHGAEVDLVAPGGCLDRDVDEDGLVDGVAGETVHARQEGTGVYLWSGTSQAAAVASGVAARLVAESPGEAPERLSAVLDRYRARPVPPDGCERWCDDEILQRAAERVSRVVRSASLGHLGSIEEGGMSWDEMAGSWDADPAVRAYAAAAFDSLERALAERGGTLEGARVLDFGCGTGLLTAAMAARAREVVGIDIAPKMVAVLRDKGIAIDPVLGVEVVDLGAVGAEEEAPAGELPRAVGVRAHGLLHGATRADVVAPTLGPAPCARVGVVEVAAERVQAGGSRVVVAAQQRIEPRALGLGQGLGAGAVVAGDDRAPHGPRLALVAVVAVQVDHRAVATVVAVGDPRDQVGLHPGPTVGVEQRDHRHPRAPRRSGDELVQQGERDLRADPLEGVDAGEDEHLLFHGRRGIGDVEGPQGLVGGTAPEGLHAHHPRSVGHRLRYLGERGSDEAIAAGDLGGLVGDRSRGGPGR